MVMETVTVTSAKSGFEGKFTSGMLPLGIVLSGTKNFCVHFMNL